MAHPSVLGLPILAGRAQGTGRFWGRWTLANALGELAGLGTAGLVGWTLAASLSGRETLLQHILVALAMIAAGAFEGAVVGAAQSWALVDRLPELSRRDWVTATASGALVAWSLGMLPSTLIVATGAETSGAPPPEISAAVRFGLAVLMGALLGPILAFFQWRVLRRHLDRSGAWMLANAAAWGLGMPVIFLGAHGVAAGGPVALRVGLVALTLLAAGAVVGAIHGVWLTWRLGGEAVEPQPSG